jgi:hypothetical protein
MKKAIGKIKDQENQKPLVYAYAFDAAGFTMPTTGVDSPGYALRFLPYESTSTLDEADALIIPSGVFEEIYGEEDMFGYRQSGLRFAPDLLVLREKQLVNAFKRGAWIVFLLRRVDNGNGRWANTDLAKKILNMFARGVHPVERNAYLACKADEFRTYLDRFGIAQTEFWIKNEKSDARVLAEADGTPVAMEINGQFFFIPFFTTTATALEATTVATLVVNSVLEYKRKHDVHLPTWLRTIQFEGERRLASEIEELEERIIELKEQQARWERYKAMLCTSGGNLNEIVVEILRDYFGLPLVSEERFVEDAIVANDDGTPRLVVEIKGVNGGLKRDNVNQVDSHRERLGLRPEVTGLLIIGDFMDVDGIEPRLEKTFDRQHLVHARAINVKILRAVTLFQLMREVEAAGVDERKARFFDLCEAADPIVEVRA